MTLITFLLICIFGMLLGLLAQPFARLSRLVAVGSLAAALAAALLLNPNDTATLGEVQLATTWFVGFFLTALTASCLLLCIVGLVTGWPERLAPAALATFAGVGFAISATDPTVALIAAAAATAPAALVASRIRSTPLGTTVGVAELRTLALVVGASVLAAVTVLNTNWNADDPTFMIAIAFVALAAAVAVRSGAVPFHVPAALLSRSGEGLGLVLSLVWIPTGFGLVALSWGATIYGVPGDWLDRAVVAVQLVAVATLILGAVGAMLHDEIEEIVAYSIIQDTGFILLALTARDADAAQPARLWLLAFILAKSALVAWAATTSWAFGSSNLGDLRGWLRRSPILGLALTGIVLATLGWPGSDVFEARGTLVRLGLPDSVHFLGTAAILLSLAYYLRLMAVGLLTPSAVVRGAAGDRPRWHPAGAEAAGQEVVAAEIAPVADAAATQVAPVADAAAAEIAPVADAAATQVAPVADAAAAQPASLPASRHADDEGPARSHRRHVSFGHQLRVAWRLNRPLQASLLVLGIAAVAAAVAFGGFGAAGASQSGITLDQAAGPIANPSAIDNGGEPTPEASVEATPAITFTPLPSPTPAATAAPSASPSATAAPSASSSASPPPSQTAGD
jgi:NADH:ubiquinone oxidoreductase subunit 2 (subunit N)